MITNVKPDTQKAKSLTKMADITLERLGATDTEKYPTNTLNDYYDIIHKLMEALAIFKGIKTKGEGAHQELIDCISKEYSFDEHTRIFLQQMRDFRNRIYYEGFTIHKNYISLNKEKIMKIIRKLMGLAEKEQ
ncbi:MAG: hypothetical protein V1659_03140 [Candidatus Woesearchaeota archaeon]